MFLTPEQLAELTGYASARSQIEWLAAHRWRFEIARNGRPVVHVKHVEEMMTNAGKSRPEPKMNLDAIRRAA